VRFVIDDSSICFVNCHLAAGQSQTTSRNHDIAAILETAALPAEPDASVRTGLFVGGGDGSMILDHEICILNGDLNYRIDTIGRDTVVSAVRANDLDKLLKRDQLLLSRRKNPGFRLRAFEESAITFPPTYKYDVGTDNYDSSEKRRAPAWCDRILYRGLGRIKQLNYRRHEIHASDHRPVSGNFRLRVKTIIPEKRARVLERSNQRFEEIKQRTTVEAK
jgi:endonuclease/exonuclease/phosphatase family metal-dependent hydrolase